MLQILSSIRVNKEPPEFPMFNTEKVPVLIQLSTFWALSLQTVWWWPCTAMNGPEHWSNVLVLELGLPGNCWSLRTKGYSRDVYNSCRGSK